MVDLLNQLRNGVHAVAHHFGRVTPGCGHELVADDQQAEVVAGHKTLDQDVVAELARRCVGFDQLFAGGDVDGHPFALVAVVGFDHHGQANFLRCSPGVFGITHGATAGDRYTGRSQQLFGQLLVLGDGFGNGAGGIHLGGLDAALFATPAQAHHAAFGHAAVGNTASHRGVHNGTGAGP